MEQNKAERKKACIAASLVVICAGSRNRTRDLLITNQLLYQLSYAGVLIWLGGATSGTRSKKCMAWTATAERLSGYAMP